MLGEDANGRLFIDPLGPNRIEQWSLNPLGTWNGGYRVNGQGSARAGRTITYASSSLTTTTRTVDAWNRVSAR